MIKKSLIVFCIVSLAIAVCSNIEQDNKEEDPEQEENLGVNNKINTNDTVETIKAIESLRGTQLKLEEHSVQVKSIYKQFVAGIKYTYVCSFQNKALNNKTVPCVIQVWLQPWIADTNKKNVVLKNTCHV